MKDKHVPKSFIGHCCEVKHKIEAAAKESTHDHCLTRSEVSGRVFKAGLLHFPELYLLLDSPMVNYVDVHGLGKENCEDREKPGILHAVLHKDLVEDMHTEAKSKLLSRNQRFVTLVNAIGPKKEFICIIDTYHMHGTMEKNSLSHTLPTAESVAGSSLLIQPKKFDVWIILAVTSPDSVHAHLVNARWKINLSKKWSEDEVKKQFFKDLLAELDHEGLELKRKGGSSGLTTYNNNGILSLLSTNSAFPRKGKAVKIVKGKKVWKCYYLQSLKKFKQTRSQRTFTKYEYPQPQVGGQLELNSRLLGSYSDVLTQMTLAKYNSAILLYNLSFTLNIVIQREAVLNALHEIESEKKYIKWLSKKVPPGHKWMNKTKHLLKLLALRNKFSVVAYPVGYHFDIFKSNEASLENKICFSFEADNTKDRGRGGDGPGRYVFALLDWTNGGSNSRRRRFIANGGILDAGQRLTSDMWQEQFGFHWDETPT